MGGSRLEGTDGDLIRRCLGNERGAQPAFGLCASRVACHPSLASAREIQFPAWRWPFREERLGRRDMKFALRLAGLACASLLLSSIGAWAGPKIVSGPGA